MEFHAVDIFSGTLPFLSAVLSSSVNKRRKLEQQRKFGSASGLANPI
jgi:hypothetical protein